MSTLLSKLQTVKDARAKIQARMDLNRERLLAIDKELASHGVTSDKDLEELERVLDAKLVELDEKLTEAEVVIKAYTERNVPNAKSALSEG